MKKILFGAALVALSASSALAQAFPPQTTAAQRARAYQTLPPTVVVQDGQIIGADPDPNVRLQLRKDRDLDN